MFGTERFRLHGKSAPAPFLVLPVAGQAEAAAAERVAGHLRGAVGAAQVLGEIVPAAAAADARGAFLFKENPRLCRGFRKL